MNDLDKRLEEIAGVILGNALLPGGEVRMRLLTPMVVAALRQAIREAVLASGAEVALDLAKQQAEHLANHYKKEAGACMPGGVAQGQAIKIADRFDEQAEKHSAALAHLRQLTKP